MGRITTTNFLSPPCSSNMFSGPSMAQTNMKVLKIKSLESLSVKLCIFLTRVKTIGKCILKHLNQPLHATISCNLWVLPLINFPFVSFQAFEKVAKFNKNGRSYLGKANEITFVSKNLFWWHFNEWKKLKFWTVKQSSRSHSSF